MLYLLRKHCSMLQMQHARPYFPLKDLFWYFYGNMVLDMAPIVFSSVLCTILQSCAWPLLLQDPIYSKNRDKRKAFLCMLSLNHTRCTHNSTFLCCPRQRIWCSNVQPLHCLLHRAFMWYFFFRETSCIWKSAVKCMQRNALVVFTM